MLVSFDYLVYNNWNFKKRSTCTTLFQVPTSVTDTGKNGDGTCCSLCSGSTVNIS